MPTLRIHFPQQEAPVTISLRGSPITLGRLPDNTIQILDRTISGHHAEFIQDPQGHYRVRDLGSTNGTAVNGEAMTDFHLTEACSLRFGNLDCEFSPEAAPEAEGIETLPTRAEMESLRQVNAELHSNVGVLRDELEALKRTSAAGSGEPLVEAFKAELQRLVLESGELREREHRLMNEITRWKIDLALVRRDRENLQIGLKSAGEEIERLKGGSPAAVAPAAQPIQASQPAEVELKLPPPTAFVPAPAAAAPPPAAAPGVTPTVRSPLKPFPPAAQPSGPAPKPPTTAIGKPAVPIARPGPRQAAPLPASAAKKPATAGPSAAGPKGTERIGLVPPASSSGARPTGNPPLTPKWVQTPPKPPEEEE